MLYLRTLCMTAWQESQAMKNEKPTFIVFTHDFVSRKCPKNTYCKEIEGRDQSFNLLREDDFKSCTMPCLRFKDHLVPLWMDKTHLTELNYIKLALKTLLLNVCLIEICYLLKWNEIQDLIQQRCSAWSKKQTKIKRKQA